MRFAAIVLAVACVSACSSSAGVTTSTASSPLPTASPIVQTPPASRPTGSPAHIAKIACAEFIEAMKTTDAVQLAQAMANAGLDAEAAGGHWMLLGKNIVAAEATGDVAKALSSWTPFAEACTRAGYIH